MIQFLVPVIAAGVAGLGLGGFVGGQVDDALDGGSGGGLRLDSLFLGVALIAVVYVVVKKT